MCDHQDLGRACVEFNYITLKSLCLAGRMTGGERDGREALLPGRKQSFIHSHFLSAPLGLALG